MGAILDRLRRQTAGQSLFEALEGLSARDLSSVLLHVFGQRSEVAPWKLLERFGELPAAQPMQVDARSLNRVEGYAFDAATGFEALVLPPVLPLGAAHTLGGTHQNNVLSCARGLEVMADPTTWLGLEAARRLSSSSEVVRLCSSQRVLRMQPFPAGLLPHFQLFALATAGPGRNEMDWLLEHAAVWLNLLQGLGARPLLLEVSDTRTVEAQLEQAGVPREAVRATVRAHDLAAGRELLESRGIVLPYGRGLHETGRRVARLEDQVLQPLSERFPKVEMAVDLRRLEGLNYYCGVTLRITIMGKRPTPIVDGGLVDWPSRLLQRRGLRMFGSGVGLDWLTRLVQGELGKRRKA